MAQTGTGKKKNITVRNFMKFSMNSTILNGVKNHYFNVLHHVILTWWIVKPLRWVDDIIARDSLRCRHYPDPLLCHYDVITQLFQPNAATTKKLLSLLFSPSYEHHCYSISSDRSKILSTRHNCHTMYTFATCSFREQTEPTTVLTHCLYTHVKF
jgi:hypothetical protein